MVLTAVGGHHCLVCFDWMLIMLFISYIFLHLILFVSHLIIDTKISKIGAVLQYVFVKTKDQKNSCETQQ